MLPLNSGLFTEEEFIIDSLTWLTMCNNEKHFSQTHTGGWTGRMHITQ